MNYIGLLFFKCDEIKQCFVSISHFSHFKSLKVFSISFPNTFWMDPKERSETSGCFLQYKGSENIQKPFLKLPSYSSNKITFS